MNIKVNIELYFFMVTLNVKSWLCFRYSNKNVSIVSTINSVHGKDSFTIKFVSAGYLKTQILLMTVRTFSRKLIMS